MLTRHISEGRPEARFEGQPPLRSCYKFTPLLLLLRTFPLTGLLQGPISLDQLYITESAATDNLLRSRVCYTSLYRQVFLIIVAIVNTSLHHRVR